MKRVRVFSTALLILMFAGISSLFAGCDDFTQSKSGNGDVMKETRKVSDFKAIDVSGAFEIVLKQGQSTEVTVEADANLLPVVRTEVSGGTLVIETKQPVRHYKTLKVYVTFRELESIDISGAVDMVSDGRLNLKDLAVRSSGATESRLDLQAGTIGLDCSGASKINLSGTATTLKLDLSGASEIHAYGLTAGDCFVDISGAGNAEVTVTKKLKTDVSGAGSIRYKGSPEEVDNSISGAGSVSKAG